MAYGDGERERARYEWAEEETIRRLREWIARREERKRLLLAEQEREAVILEDEIELTNV